MATKRYCDIDGKLIGNNDWSFDLNLMIRIRPDNDRIAEPTLGGPIPIGKRDYTPISTRVDDVCEDCARAIAQVVRDRKGQA